MARVCDLMTNKKFVVISYLLLIITIFLGFLLVFSEIFYKRYMFTFLSVTYLIWGLIIISRSNYFKKYYNTNTIFRFLCGDFYLKHDIHPIPGKYFSMFDKKEFGPNGRRFIFFYIFGLALIFVFNAKYTDSLMVTGFSLISICVAMTIVSFNYANIGLNDDIHKKTKIAGARRFYLSSIYAIFTVISIIIINYLDPMVLVLKFNYTGLIELSWSYFKLTGCVILGLIYVTLLAQASRFIIEGLILTLRETVEFDTD